MFAGARAEVTLKSTLLSLAITVSLLSPARCLGSGPPAGKFDGLVNNGAILLAGHGQPLVAINPDAPLTPASTLKIATSLMAINILGEDFHFTTYLYLHNNMLYIQGSGDPFLVSEEIAKMAAMLRDKGITKIDGIVLDDSRFKLKKEDFYGNSNNPYEALNGALAVNFNTINVEKSPDGKVRSSERQTPTLPLMQDFAANLPAGTQRISLPRRQSVTLRYCGELFRAIFKKSNIRVNGSWQHGKVPANVVPVLTYQSSKTLAELLKGMLLYSNNFTANQLFLRCAVDKSEGPITWEKARHTARQYFARHGFSEKDLFIYEGSGLSRKNRITARAMLRLLHLFSPYRALLPEKKGGLVKSGTLDGVYCYAGYLDPHGGSFPFVIMLNQARNTRDTILARLQRVLDTTFKTSPSNR